MGQTLKNLALKETSSVTVFNNRFVVEICEAVHVHYRNLRIIMSLRDWKEMARGMADSLLRWEKQGSPETSPSAHIELCRKTVGLVPVVPDTIQINLNKNLYALHEGKVFAEGAELKEPLYIHLKIRDLRLEMTLDEFEELAQAVIEAKSALAGGVHAE